MLSAIAIFSVLEVVIGWVMKGRGLWSFYKDLKKWIKEKKEKKQHEVKKNYKQQVRTVYRSTKRKSNRRIVRGRKVA